jgi:hypothetical protein
MAHSAGKDLSAVLQLLLVLLLVAIGAAAGGKQHTCISNWVHVASRDRCVV